METTGNQAIVERLYRAIAADDAEDATAIIAPDFVNHAAGGRRGAELFVAIGRAIKATFPDARRTIHDLVAAGDRVVVRETLYGTHRGSALPFVAGIPTDGPVRRVEVHSHLPAA